MSTKNSLLPKFLTSRSERHDDPRPDTFIPPPPQITVNLIITGTNGDSRRGDRSRSRSRGRRRRSRKDDRSRSTSRSRRGRSRGDGRSTSRSRRGRSRRDGRSTSRSRRGNSRRHDESRSRSAGRSDDKERRRHNSRSHPRPRLHTSKSTSHIVSVAASSSSAGQHLAISSRDYAPRSPSVAPSSTPSSNKSSRHKTSHHALPPPTLTDAQLYAANTRLANTSPAGRALSTVRLAPSPHASTHRTRIPSPSGLRSIASSSSSSQDVYWATSQPHVPRPAMPSSMGSWAGYPPMPEGLAAIAAQASGAGQQAYASSIAPRPMGARCETVPSSHSGQSSQSEQTPRARGSNSPATVFASLQALPPPVSQYAASQVSAHRAPASANPAQYVRGPGHAPSMASLKSRRTKRGDDSGYVTGVASEYGTPREY
ncbi:hypothetical protein DENSPDRAFT_614845 [Dentipellis sp. KUC8613]|nr:hypothetical protein DENSPDRAFT_614845 [Dentipellis sp. KUC8613]